MSHEPNKLNIAEFEQALRNLSREEFDAALKEAFGSTEAFLESFEGELSPYPHWSRDAIVGLRPLIAKVPQGDESYHRQHLYSMVLKVIISSDWSPTKVCRWLGYIQAALVFSGVATLEQMKQHNLRYSEAAKAASQAG